MDPLADGAAVEKALSLACAEAERYLADIDARPVRVRGADEAALVFGGPLPEEGTGALAALSELIEQGGDAAIQSGGPRFFHFVMGGATPAALGAEWIASAFDQNAASWVTSPLATQLELVTIDWLKELFRLPAEWGGVLTTGATMATFVGLAAARRWWGQRHDVDVDAHGLAGLPRVPVLTSGYVHSSARKALAMLGIGRETVQTLSRDAVGRLDVHALERALRGLGDAPAIVIANAGEVNAGDFDPIARMAELADEYGAWLHVDGAFGLFARATPRAAELADGVERANSLACDGHKWLNVPYDCGFAFVRERSLLPGAFGVGAPYLPALDGPHPTLAYSTPEGTRRARSLAAWATLRAYGRSGYRALVERHLDLARRVANRVDEADNLERLAEVKLNIVCFRFRPPGLSESELDDLNERLGEAVLEDGRVYVGTTRYGGRVAFRPAIVNWRTQEADVDLLVDVIRELGARLLARDERATARR